MKKIAIVLVLCLLVVGIAVAQDSVTVDISKLEGAVPSLSGDGTMVVRNQSRLTPSPGGGNDYAFWIQTLPEGTFPADAPWATYDKIRVKFRYYRANGNAIRQGNSNCMVVIMYDAAGDSEGPPQGPGPNTPVKIFNVGGANGNVRISSPAGAPIRPLTKAPGGIVMQRQGNSSIATIELEELTFFK